MVVLITCAATARAQPVTDGVKIAAKVDYYDVEGNTWPEVFASIMARRLIVPGQDQRYEGVTQSVVSLGPDTDVTADACSSEAVTVNLSLVVKVPRFSHPRDLDAKGQECWAFYDRSLTDHEEGHVQIAIRQAEDLLRALRAARGASCQRLQRLAAERIAQMEPEQDAYDAVTSHGVEQWRRFDAYTNHEPEGEKALRAQCIPGAATQR